MLFYLINLKYIYIKYVLRFFIFLVNIYYLLFIYFINLFYFKYILFNIIY